MKHKLGCKKFFLLITLFISIRSFGQEVIVYEDLFNTSCNNTSGVTTTCTNGSNPNNTRWGYTETVGGPNGISYNFTGGYAYLQNTYGVNTDFGYNMIYKGGDGYYGGPDRVYDTDPNFSCRFTSNTQILEWSFNFDGSNTPWGLTNGANGSSFGGAFIIGMDSPTLQSCSFKTQGYAVIFGDASGSNTVKLVSFNGGTTDNNCATNNQGIYTFFNWNGTNSTSCIVADNTAITSNWYSVKVQYNPANDEWRLFVRNDGGSPQDPQTLNSSHGKGANINSLYTNNNLRIMGFYACLNDMGTNRYMRYDNLRIKRNVTQINTGTTGQCGAYAAPPCTPTINTNPGNQTICQNNSANFSVNASNANGYQWQFSSDNVNFSNVSNNTPANASYSGQTTSTLTVSGNISGGPYYYRCIVQGTSAACDVNSNAASLTINTESSAPTSVSASNSTICSGNNTTLTANGGSLGSGASYSWFSGSCTGTFVGTGASISVSPSSTTTYFVKIVGTCNTTACASQTVTVNSTSSAPTSITYNPNQICSGSSATVTANGGTVGVGGVYSWFSGSCNGTFVGTGASITVNPTSTTTYYVSIAGTCNTTSCVSATLNVATPSVGATSASSSVDTICSGSSANLSVNGGSLGTTAQWVWYDGDICAGPATAVATGASVTVTPSSSTTYYVRSEDACGNTNCVNIYVHVKPGPNPPTGLTADPSNVCPGNSTNLVGYATLGPGESLQWHADSCNGPVIGTSNVQPVSPTTTTTYYLNVIGTCGSSPCISKTISLYTRSVEPSVVNNTKPVACPGDSVLLYITDGSLGTGATQWNWYVNDTTTTPVGSGDSLWVVADSAATYYVQTDGTCNTSLAVSSSITLNTNSVPADSINSSAVNACQGSSATLTVAGGSLGTGADWYWFTGSCNGTPIDTGSSITVSPNDTTTYYVLAAGTCNTTICRQIDQNIIADVNPAWNITSTVCASQGIVDLNSLVSGTTGGSWTVNGSPSSNLFDAANFVGQTVSITYSVGVNPCTEDSTISLNVSDSVSAAWSVPLDGICDNTPLDLSTLVTGTNGGTWNGNGVSGAIFDPSGLTGSISIEYLVVSGSCADSSTQNITINSAPLLTSLSVSDDTVCVGSSITISGTATGHNPVIYIFNDTTAVDLGSTPYTTIVNSDTLFYAQVTDGNGCKNNGGFSPINIFVNPLPNSPTLSLSAPAICLGQSLTISVSNPQNGIAYPVYSNSALTNLVGYADTTITPTVGDTLYYFAQDTLTGCVNAGGVDSVVFTVNNIPNDPILSLNDTSICSGASINIGVTNSQSGVIYSIYTDTTAAPVGTATASFSPTGDVTYYVNAAYNSGCTNAGGYSAVSVNVNTLPNSPTLSLSAPAICLGQSLTISVSNPQNGIAYPVYSNAALTNLVGYADTSFSPSASGSLFYFAQDTLTGCVNAGGVDSVSFTVNTLPLAPAFSNNDTSVCAGTTVSLPLINPQTGVTYNVYTDTTLAPIGTAPGAFNPADTTTYYVQAVDNNGCKNAGAFSPYTLNPIALPLNPAVSLSEDSVCNGQSAALTITSPEPNVSYTVYDSQTAGNVLGTTPYTSSYSSSTTVFVEAINSNGCKNAGGRVPVTVTVNPSPVADAGVNQITCPGENVIFTATGGGVYSWNNGNNTASFTLSNVAAAQQGYYTVTVTNSFGCQNKDSVLLTVNNISVFDAADDSSTVDFNASASLDVAINDNGASASSPVIITNPRSGSASVSGSIITYTPNAGFTGTDSLVYQICDNVCANICKTATVYFRVEKEVVIIVPGGVSPNGDGKNDFLDIKGIELFPDNELLIYNRWGDLVFEAKPYKNDWKGQSINAALRVVGDEVTDGTYYYILKLNPQDKGITGFTELRRK